MSPQLAQAHSRWRLKQQPLVFSPAFSAISLCLIVTIIVTLFSRVASAQPSIDIGSKWAVIDERTFYLQSDKWVYSLDLTKAFVDTNPPWTPQAPEPAGFYNGAMIVTADKSKLVVIDHESRTETTTTDHDHGVYTYTISTNNWQNTTILKNFSYFSGGCAVLVPDTNMAYIFNGYLLTTQVFSTMVYDVTMGTSTPVKPPLIPDKLDIYTAVWSTLRKSILIHGGLIETAKDPGYVAVSTFYEYFPSTNTASNLITSGAGPGKLFHHCLVSAYGGRKLVVFGGQSELNGKYLGGIFILDLTTLIWTTGKPTTNARIGMACAAAGDNFLVVGGSNESAVWAPKAPLIYNMRTNQWVNQFEPATLTVSSISGSSPGPTNSSPNTQPTDTTTTTPSSHGSSAGAIGGGIGAVIVLTAIGLFIFYRRKRSKRMSISKDDGQLNQGDHKTHTQNPDGKDPFGRSTLRPSSTSSIASRRLDHDSSLIGGAAAMTYSLPPLVPGQSMARSPQQDTLSNFNSQSSGRSPQGFLLDHQQVGRVVGVGSRGMSSAALLAIAQSTPQNPSSPHKLIQQSTRSNPATTHSAVRDSMSTVASPTARLSSIVETKEDLTKRQLALIQVQQELDRERLRVEEKLKMRRMEEAEGRG